MFFFNKKAKNKITVKTKEIKQSPKSFFDLSSEEQKRIIKKAAIEANKEQRKVEAEYNKKLCIKCN